MTATIDARIAAALRGLASNTTQDNIERMRRAALGQLEQGQHPQTWADADILTLIDRIDQDCAAITAGVKLAEACLTGYSDPPAPPGDWMDWVECLLCDTISRQSAPEHAPGCPVAAVLALKERP